MCTSDLCNDLEYDIHTERANRLFLNQTAQQQKQLQNSPRLQQFGNQGLFESLSSSNHSLGSEEEDDKEKEESGGEEFDEIDDDDDDDEEELSLIHI